jgi:hypothetical protein
LLYKYKSTNTDAEAGHTGKLREAKVLNLLALQVKKYKH